MNAFNPYEPSSRGPNSSTEFRNLIIHFLAFGSTFILLALAITCYQSGFQFTVGKMNLRLSIRLVGMTTIFWLPHAFVTMRSFKASRAGAGVSGVFGASFFVFGCYIIEWLLHNWMFSLSWSGIPIFALSMLQSLAAVAILGFFWPKSVESKRERDESQQI